MRSGIWIVKPDKPLFIEEASMKKQRKDVGSGEELFVGIDLHKLSWHVSIRTADAELFSGSLYFDKDFWIRHQTAFLKAFIGCKTW